MSIAWQPTQRFTPPTQRHFPNFTSTETKPNLFQFNKKINIVFGLPYLTMEEILPRGWKQQQTLSKLHPSKSPNNTKKKTKNPTCRMTPAQKSLSESLIAILWASLPARPKPYQNTKPEVSEKIPEGWTISKSIPTGWRRQGERILEGWTIGKSIPTGWKRQSSAYMSSKQECMTVCNSGTESTSSKNDDPSRQPASQPQESRSRQHVQ